MVCWSVSCHPKSHAQEDSWRKEGVRCISAIICVFCISRLTTLLHRILPLPTTFWKKCSWTIVTPVWATDWEDNQIGNGHWVYREAKSKISGSMEAGRGAWPGSKGSIQAPPQQEGTHRSILDWWSGSSDDTITHRDTQDQWSGPYVVEERLNKTTYWVCTPDQRKKSRLFHVNSMKIWRQTSTADYGSKILRW